MIAESGSPMGNDKRPFYDFLEGCLRHKSEMVIFEAARAICNMKDVSSRRGTPTHSSARAASRRRECKASLPQRICLAGKQHAVPAGGLAASRHYTTIGCT